MPSTMLNILHNICLFISHNSFIKIISSITNEKTGLKSLSNLFRLQFEIR